MKKTSLLIAALGLFSSSVFASNYCQYGEGNQSSSNSILTPQFFTVSNWQGVLSYHKRE